MLGFDETLQGILESLTPLQKGLAQEAIDDRRRPLRDRIDTLTALGIPADKAVAALKGI